MQPFHGTYAAAFADINAGSNGGCTICTARTGYDVPTGLGTLNVSGCWGTLSGASISTPPVVSSAGVSGKAGS
ncbi:MAG: hypothetical protein IPL70_06950, partial [Uliginosibacterium sp.]|nr:hypothetical protein [Uliginosibacterium sp.]